MEMEMVLAAAEAEATTTMAMVTIQIHIAKRAQRESQQKCIKRLGKLASGISIAGIKRILMTTKFTTARGRSRS